MRAPVFTSLVLLFTAVAAIAQNSGAPADATANQGRNERDAFTGIYGTVLDPAEGEIADAQIKIIDEKGNMQTAYSDAKGRFKLMLEPGTYKLEIAMQGFQTARQKVEVRNGPQQLNFVLKLGTCCSGPDVTAAPQVEPPPAVTEVDSLNSGNVVPENPHDKTKTANAPGIHGTVIDPSGAILVQGPVVATDERGKRYTARVDLNGRYRLDLPAGKYKVEAAARGFQTATQNVQIEKGAQELNFQLKFSLRQEAWSGPTAPPPVEIEPADTSTSWLQSVVPEEVQKAIKSGVYGMVVDPTGAVIPRTHVVAIDQHGKSYDTCSNSEGTFQMKLKRGSYQVSASAQGFRTVTQSVEVTKGVHDLNFRLSVESGSSMGVAGEPTKPEPVRADPCPK